MAIIIHNQALDQSLANRVIAYQQQRQKMDKIEKMKKKKEAYISLRCISDWNQLKTCFFFFYDNNYRSILIVA